MRDYGVDTLSSLGPGDRRALDLTPRPIQSRAPRRFGRGGLPAPVSPGTTVASLRAGYASGVVTPHDVLERLATRISKGAWGRALFSPFSDLDLDRARQATDAATKRWRAGRPLSLLDGIPVSVKDQQNVVGLPTRAGTRYLTAPAERDAFVVRTLREAGAVLFAKTKMTEWGMSPVGYSPHFDLPRCVYSNDHAAGGSSTGAGVAVALGYGPVAVGGDGGGSIRIPAGVCGVYGLKPTFGRVSRIGDVCGEVSVFHVGPLAASVQDIAEWMSVCGVARDPEDDCSVWASDTDGVAQEWVAAVGRGVTGARVGVLRSEIADAPATIANRVDWALRELERAGATLTDVRIPLAEHAGAIGMLVIGSEAMANLVEHLDAHGADMGDDLRLVASLVRTMSSQDVFMAGRYRAALRRQAAQVFDDVDLLALPTTACLARPYARSEAGAHISDAVGTRRLTRFAFFANLTGLPAGTVPCGLGETAQAALPVGFQLIGDAWDEASVIAAMAACARAGVCDVPRPDGWAPLLD